jgi:UDP-N-acetylglucosamine 4,6-dehydratase
MTASFLTHDVAGELNGKSVLVTGGTGSFGKHFVRTVLKKYRVRRLIIFSRDEQKQFDMQNELNDREFPELRYFIGDVRDRDRLEYAVNGVDVLIHAAALKHVPAAEYNPTECIHTNVNGAENVVRAAVRGRVKKVIALSTDKAVNPVNLYGASKLCSDKIFVAANNISGAEGTRFSVVRYGNVVGSRGSVAPFFQGLIAKGADSLPITDERMTRFWITLQQGVELVLSSLGVMAGGEVFVPKIPSMKVTDLASSLAPDLPHKVVGIRPGEKLHEIMITPEDSLQTREFDDRYVIYPSHAFWSRSNPMSGGKAVPEGFSYSSDNNTVWLDRDQIKQMIAVSVI